MGKWTSLAIEAETGQKRPTHELPELTEPNQEGVLSVLSVPSKPVFREFEELRSLINVCADHWQFTQEEREEVLRAALNDPENALTCYRDIAAKARLSPKPAPSKVH